MENPMTDFGWSKSSGAAEALVTKDATANENRMVLMVFLSVVGPNDDCIADFSIERALTLVPSRVFLRQSCCILTPYLEVRLAVLRQIFLPCRLERSARCRETGVTHRAGRHQDPDQNQQCHSQRSVLVGFPDPWVMMPTRTPAWQACQVTDDG
jgi:hypothetical protein